MIQMAVILGSVFLLTFFILVLIHTLQHLPPHITIKLHASHPTPRLTSTPRFKHRTPRSTSNATLPPHNIHQARYNATPSKQTALATHDTVWTRLPERRMEKRRGVPPKTPTEDDGVLSVVGKREAGQAESPPGTADIKNTRPVTLTSRRRVRSPDWQRERRHAKKGRGTREGGGPRRRGLG